MSFENKLKGALIGKIKRYCEILDDLIVIASEQVDKNDKELSEFVDNLSDEEKGEFFNPPDPEGEPIVLDEESIEEEALKAMRESESIDYTLMGLPDEYSGLKNEFKKLQVEINQLMIECKLTPLLGLSADELKILHKKDEVTGKSFSEVKQSERDIEEYLEQRALLERQDMKKRINDLTPLLLNFQIDLDTLYFYKQIHKCYIYGIFEATCIFSRAIAETLLKKYIGYKGHGNLLSGGINKKNDISLTGICLNVLNMDKNLIGLYTKIREKADRILHRKIKATEEESLAIIKVLREFMERFPKQI